MVPRAIGIRILSLPVLIGVLVLAGHSRAGEGGEAASDQDAVISSARGAFASAYSGFESASYAHDGIFVRKEVESPDAVAGDVERVLLQPAGWSARTGFDAPIPEAEFETWETRLRSWFQLREDRSHYQDPSNFHLRLRRRVCVGGGARFDVDRDLLERRIVGGEPTADFSSSRFSFLYQAPAGSIVVCGGYDASHSARGPSSFLMPAFIRKQTFLDACTVQSFRRAGSEVTLVLDFHFPGSNSSTTYTYRLARDLGWLPRSVEVRADDHVFLKTWYRWQLVPGIGAVPAAICRYQRVRLGVAQVQMDVVRELAIHETLDVPKLWIPPGTALFDERTSPRTVLLAHELSMWPDELRDIFTSDEEGVLDVLDPSMRPPDRMRLEHPERGAGEGGNAASAVEPETQPEGSDDTPWLVLAGLLAVAGLILWRWRSKVRAIVFCLVLSVAAGCSEPTGDEEPNGPEEHALDIGVVTDGVLVTRTFQVENQSTRTWKVIRVSPSCACVTADPDRNVILPGDFFEVTLTLDTGGSRGGRTVRALYEFDGRVPLALHLKCRVEPTFRTSQREVDFGKVSVCSRACQRIRLELPRSSPRLDSVTARAKELTVSIAESTHGDHALIDVTFAPRVVGPFRSTVEFATESGQCTVLPVHAFVVAPVEACPADVLLMPSAAENSLVGYVRFVAADREWAAHLRGCEVEATEGLEIDEVVMSGPFQRSFEIRAKAGGGIKGHVRLRMDVPDARYSMVEVAVRAPAP